jgi:hypothetical protein
MGLAKAVSIGAYQRHWFPVLIQDRELLIIKEDVAFATPCPQTRREIRPYAGDVGTEDPVPRCDQSETNLTIGMPAGP